MTAAPDPIERWKQQNPQLRELMEALGFSMILCGGSLRVVDEAGDVDLSPDLFAAISRLHAYSMHQPPGGDPT